MKDQFLAPIIITPAFKEALWGGTRLRDEWGKVPTEPLSNIAETWEFSTHPGGPSYVGSGTKRGELLSEYLAAGGARILGAPYRDTTLPILTKYIDAAQSLSIQVHPDNAYARAHENSPGKTEMWYIADSTPDAYIYYGLTHEISPEEFAQRITEQTLTEVLHKITVKPGQTFLLPAGVIHAIGPGCLIAEIQQACDITYRVYDYGRRDNQGKLRDLHIEQAKAVSQLGPAPSAQSFRPVRLEDDSIITALAHLPEFTVGELKLQKDVHFRVEEVFHLLMVTSGQTMLTGSDETLQLKRGTTAFLPAKSGEYRLQGQATILIITCEHPEATFPSNEK